MTTTDLFPPRARKARGFRGVTSLLSDILLDSILGTAIAWPARALARWAWSRAKVWISDHWSDDVDVDAALRARLGRE